MDRLEKIKALSLKKADAAADISLINRYSVRELRPEEVYCLSVILCDNEIDRDIERFTDACLEALAPLFLGKTGISDHRWSAERQIARLYRVEVEDSNQKNTLGEPLRVLRGSAYMLRSETNRPVIEAIEGGIMKEVSIGCRVGKCSCSICGEPLRLNWGTFKYQCENGHIKGDWYDRKLCVGNLEDPIDAYEFSFVAVPAQPGAGVTKCCGKCTPEKRNIDCANRVGDPIGDAFELLISTDLSEHVERITKLIPHLQKALLSAPEREERARILAENHDLLAKYPKKYKNQEENHA